ncbi:MAG: sigma-70 family RNA polymerase sigma factor [Phaeodactylibacter sp.]|nr:sigma-70 family RNA polymerase sigma factor [Phaeodactylibacter sp.]
MDDSAFKAFLLKAHAYCLPKLNRLTQSAADSEDVFMEAAYQFWKDLQSGKIKNQRNLKALLFVMAKNRYISLQRKRKRKSLQEHSTDPQLIHLESAAHQPQGNIPDPLVEQEEAAAEAQVQQHRQQAFDRALQQLDAKCRELLLRFIVEKERLKDLAQSLGYPSVDAVKMAKYRCKEKLVEGFGSLV